MSFHEVTFEIPMHDLPPFIVVPVAAQTCPLCPGKPHVVIHCDSCEACLHVPQPTVWPLDTICLCGRNYRITKAYGEAWRKALPPAALEIAP